MFCSQPKHRVTKCRFQKHYPDWSHIFVVLAQQNSSLKADMPLHWETLS